MFLVVLILDLYYNELLIKDLRNSRNEKEKTIIFNSFVINISIGSVSNNNIEMNFLRGGVINLQGANINNITIGEINNNNIIGNENSTSTGFVLYLRESSTDSKISSNIGNLTVRQITGNTIRAKNITSFLFRSALVPVENATVISKNGNVTVDEISNNNLVATDCDENARGGMIYKQMSIGQISSVLGKELIHIAKQHLQ